MAIERLQKFLADGGVASRRKAEVLITSGKISVNGKVVTLLGTKIDTETDRVEFDGKIVKPIQQKTIYAFYKPLGVTSTVSDAHAGKTITDFFPKTTRVYPVGRLDKNSEGLILVTNDGELANQLTHPRYEHEKEYYVIVVGKEEFLNRFNEIFIVEGSKTQPMKYKLVKPLGYNHWLISLTLKEGKKRQIREIAKQIGFKIEQLKRNRIGKLHLNKLKVGEYRPVSQSDIL